MGQGQHEGLEQNRGGPRWSKVSDPCTCLLEVVTQQARNISALAVSPHAHPEELQQIRDALVEIGWTGSTFQRLPDSTEVRRWLGLVVDSSQVQSSGPYQLSEFAQALQEKPLVFEAAFSDPLLAASLGVILAAPTLYHQFNQQRDSLQLEAVTSRLRRHLSPEAFERWQQIAARSLLMGYADSTQSPSPDEYAKAAQLLPYSIPLPTIDDVKHAQQLFGDLLRIDERIPIVLWELITPEARQHIAQELPLEVVLSWTESRMAEVASQSRAIRDASKRLEPEPLRYVNGFDDDGAQQTRQLQLRSDFSGILGQMQEVCGFLTSFFDTKLTLQDGRSISFDERARLQERIQDKIGVPIHTAMTALFECMLDETTRFECPLEFSLQLGEFIGEMGVYLDELCEESGHDAASNHDDSGASITCAMILVDSFNVAVRAGDFHSANALRMLFPPDDRQRPTTRRFTIDDHIEEHSAWFLKAFRVECRQIYQLMRDSKHSEMTTDIQRRIEGAIGVLQHFPLHTSMTREDQDLLAGFTYLMSGLLERDAHHTNSTREAARFDSPDASSFSGCRRVAELVRLCRSSALQRHILEGSFCYTNSPCLSVVADFIAASNRSLASALDDVARGQRNPESILDDVSNAFHAWRLYCAAGAYKDQLPAAMLEEIPAMVRLGHQIQTQQERLVIPTDAPTRIETAHLDFLRNWRDGLIGMQRSPRRRELLLNFLKFIKEGRGSVSPQARELVFDSMGVFASEFVTTAKSGVTSREFQDGVSFIIGGFMASSSALKPQVSLSMAHALSELFRLPQASQIAGDREKANQIAECFDELSQPPANKDFTQGLKAFLRKSAIVGFLSSVGLNSTESA